MNQTTSPVSALPWTGERMIPFEADPVTEFFHWQRYLYFRPWYQNAKIIDAASGEGYGIGYAAQFARSAQGFDLAPEAVLYSAAKYPSAQFGVGDVCELDYSGADLVTSFETIEHLPDPEKFLQALSKCPGRIVISTPNRFNHSPGNRLQDQPLNPFHTIEWTPSEFKELIESHFPGRQVRMLSQEDRFPGLIREGLDESAKYAIAVIGDGDLPAWPRIGISIPTCNGGKRTEEAVYNFARFYPGEMEFAVVDNGSGPETIHHLGRLECAWPHLFHPIRLPENLGYGRGANAGLEFLLKKGGFDLLGVSNDDVIASLQCVVTMVGALEFLTNQGQKPGLIGPMSNSVSGAQCIDLGPFQNYREMMGLADRHSRAFHNEYASAIQVRGLFFLAPRECIEAVGGFDPIFGLGNFEDDDFNLRVRHAGFSLWVAQGAFLYHAGSTTFKDLKLDYSKNIDRNLKLFLEKWRAGNHADAMSGTQLPSGVDLRIALDATAPSSGFHMNFGQEDVDLVFQATEAEFAAAVMLALQGEPRGRRVEVLRQLSSRAA